MMARRSVQHYFRIAVRGFYLALRAGLIFVRRALGLLAVGSHASPANDELSSSIRGGVLNFRTGKFDDGTDPAGIYELD
jgi:hypothetical protein